MKKNNNFGIKAKEKLKKSKKEDKRNHTQRSMVIINKDVMVGDQARESYAIARNQPRRSQMDRCIPLKLNDYEIFHDTTIIAKRNLVQFSFLVESKPVSFEQALQNPHWRLAMEEELESIKKIKLGISSFVSSNETNWCEIEEEVYISQPPSFEVIGQENKVYKLKKAMYCLKQALQAWKKRINSLLV
ncbi:hypothetical protein CR513_03977, partial [Mucuna pruriens]